MTKAKDTGSKQQVASSKPPQQSFSKFSGNKGNFGFTNIQKLSAKAQFTPPAIRVTQNKGGGGK